MKYSSSVEITSGTLRVYFMTAASSAHSPPRTTPPASEATMTKNPGPSSRVAR